MVIITRGAKNIFLSGNLANGEIILLKNVFAGHGVLQRSNEYSNQTGESKLSFINLLTYFSEESLHILMFARMPILPKIMTSKIEQSKKASSFSHKCKAIIFSLFEKTFIEKFSGKAENFLGT